jgi:hypothetical protein
VVVPLYRPRADLALLPERREPSAAEDRATATTGSPDARHADTVWLLCLAPGGAAIDRVGDEMAAGGRHEVSRRGYGAGVFVLSYAR